MNNVDILKNGGIEVAKGLELLGDMEMYNSILLEFYNGYYERMKKIESYKINSDMANYAIEVHSLKSDSRYLGITRLADLAYQHEMASKANDISSVNNSYNELVLEGNRIISIINEYFMSGKSSNSSATADNSNEKALNNNAKTILIADDSSIIRDFVKEIFHDKYNVLMASDGEEVINIVKTNPNIAALLLDLNMPNISGFEVLEYFKQNNLFKEVPVSIISGANDKDSIDKAFNYNIVDMLNKPFNKDNVRIVVEKTIAFKN